MKKNIIKMAAFLVVGVGMFFGVQEILTPDQHYTELNGLKSLDETVDVVFLGSSHIAYAVSPMELYESTGVASYNLGSSGQPIECSYFMLKKALQTQTNIELVVLDVSTLFHTDNTYSNDMFDGFWRMLLNGMPMDSVKIEMAQAYDEMPCRTAPARQKT